MVRRIPLTAALAAIACLALGPAVAVSQAVPPQAHSHGAPASAKKAPSASPSAPRAHESAPIAERIEAHPELATRLNPLLPSGMTLEQASQGFRNEGQFIAALHVSHNLDIPFAQLKAEMTGADHDSLGQAIHTLKPGANAKAETKKAEAEAKEDVKASGKHKANDRDRH